MDSRNKVERKDTFLLKNVKLETGFIRDDENKIVATKTEVFDMHISEGKIKTISNKGSFEKEDLERIDAIEFLMLPNMQDLHIHIDKTYFGGQWRAAPWTGNIKTMIALEKKMIPQLLPNSQERAEKCIDLMQSYGSTFARLHCNVEPTSGLQSLEHLHKALANYKDSFEWDIVAFPQHGILYSDAEGLLRDAAKMDIDFIGGLDPSDVDTNMKKSMDIMFDIALEYNKGIDIHLHEGMPSGKKVMDYMLERVKDNVQLQGKTFISHAYALSMLDSKTLEQMANQFAEYGIGIVSSIPIGSQALPIPILQKHGVNILVGTDNIMDNFSPFGSGDMLEKSKRCAELYGWTDEYRLNRALQFATNGQMPLNDAGDMVWPKENSAANFVLVDASCSAEAVARLPKREAVFHKGKQVVSNRNS